MTPEQTDLVFKALADPTRRRIVERLRERPEQSLFEICADTVAGGEKVLSRQAVSQHLDVLEQAGLVSVRWSGRTKLHRLETGPLTAALSGWVEKIVKEDLT